jgi:hypothetical protein
MFDTILRILISSTGYSEEDPNSSLDKTSPAAVRAVDRLKQMAVDFDRLRDAILPLGVDEATQTWSTAKVLTDVRMAEEGSPASTIKYNLSDEQKATFLNGILDLCEYVCNPPTIKNKETSSDDVIINIEAKQETKNETKITDASAETTTMTGDTSVNLPSDEDFMEGIERIRVASKLRDLHGLFENQVLFEATRDVQKKMTEMMSQRADDVSKDKDELLEMQRKCRKVKQQAIKELDEAKSQIQQQEKVSSEFGPRMETLFDKRNAKHDEQLSLLELSDAAADYMLTQQQSMLKGRECFCLVVDKRQVRRNCYCCISIIIIIAMVYATIAVPGI